MFIIFLNLVLMVPLQQLTHYYFCFLWMLYLVSFFIFSLFQNVFMSLRHKLTPLPPFSIKWFVFNMFYLYFILCLTLHNETLFRNYNFTFYLTVRFEWIDMSASYGSQMILFICQTSLFLLNLFLHYIQWYLFLWFNDGRLI